MKPLINNLNDALTYQLEGMYDAEKQIQKEFLDFEKNVVSASLKKEVTNYLECAADKRTKLKRIFSYLLAGPFGRRNIVIRERLKEMNDWNHLIAPSLLRDRMIVASMQNLIQGKIAAYGMAKVFAEELTLQTVSDLLEEIMMWEKESIRSLSKIILELESFNEENILLQQ